MQDSFVVVCGLVNGKNSYGGYTGATPFFAVVAKTPTNGQTREMPTILPVILDEDTSEFDLAMAHSVCGFSRG